MCELLKTRRSVRKYRPEQVPDELLDAVLEAGLYAPSAMNNQKPVMVAVRDKATRDQLSAMNAAVMGTDRDPFYGAPCVIVVLADPTLSHMGGRRFSGAGQSAQRRPRRGAGQLLDQPRPGDVRHPGGQGTSAPVGHPGTLPGHRLLHSGLRRRGSRPQGAGSQPHLENLTKEKNDGLSGNCPRPAILPQL